MDAIINSCDQVVKLLKIQKDIIQRNVPKYAWYRHIVDHNKAILDFIMEYGNLFKQFYCQGCCPHYNQCEIYKKMIEDLNK